MRKLSSDECACISADGSVRSGSSPSVSVSRNCARLTSISLPEVEHLLHSQQALHVACSACSIASTSSSTRSRAVRRVTNLTVSSLLLALAAPVRRLVGWGHLRGGRDLDRGLWSERCDSEAVRACTADGDGGTMPRGARDLEKFAREENP